MAILSLKGFFMPIYEFKCDSCGAVNEVIMGINDDNPKICSVCNGGPLKKIMSMNSFVLKGKGWYETDFKDNKKNEKKIIKDSKSPKNSSDKKAKKTK